MSEATPASLITKCFSYRTRQRNSGSKVFTWTGVLRLCLLGIIVLLVVGVTWLYVILRGSLPQLEGERALAGLSAPVAVTRDRLGVPLVQGANRIDVAHATGFLHAQDRFFQMDLLRRQAAGELAELFGAGALEADREVRVHRFRTRAREVFSNLPRTSRALLKAYAAGVNDGLATLDTPPFEYLILRSDPQSWRPEDSLLVVYVMYLDLQGGHGRREATYGLMHDVLPAPLYTFLTPRGTAWDAPLQGGPLTSRLALPDPEVIDLRAMPALGRAVPEDDEPMAPHTSLGSNNWAVAREYTVHGGALLANDMHLGLTVPNTWYRLSIRYPDAQGHQRRIAGVSLPGMPAIVVGSNGYVAWGFTNSFIDWSDLVVLEPVAGHPNSYRTPNGPRRFEHHAETLRVKDGEPQTMKILSTIWGPVIDQDHRGRQRVLRWVAHHRDAVNLRLMALEHATSVEHAIAVASLSGIPAQNLIVADSQGNIGWTIAGAVPNRFGHDGRLPVSWADGQRGWDGLLKPEAYPQVINPQHGRLWTANARLVGGADLQKLGDGGYELGARAGQIRDDLFKLSLATETDMLKIQLDDRAVFLKRWRDLLLRTLTPEALTADPRRQALRRYVQKWGGAAATDSVGYHIVRTFRLFVQEQAFESLTRACKAADARFDYDWIAQSEGPLWHLVSKQPLHLLDRRFKTWQDQLLAGVDATLDYFLHDGSGLEDQSWGTYNTSQIQHRLSPYLPIIARWLDMPAERLPGDMHMPRVQGPSYGASLRMVVSPGREEHGIFHMPSGQSGHPLFPHYHDSHQAWVKGEPTPFLPGPAVHALRLVPMEKGK